MLFERILQSSSISRQAGGYVTYNTRSCADMLCRSQTPFQLVRILARKTTHKYRKSRWEVIGNSHLCVNLKEAGDLVELRDKLLEAGQLWSSITFVWE